jgi:hypothetical protein
VTRHEVTQILLLHGFAREGRTLLIHKVSGMGLWASFTLDKLDFEWINFTGDDEQDEVHSEDYALDALTIETLVKTITRLAALPVHV